MIPAALSLITSFFFHILRLIIFIACSLKHSQNFFIQSFPFLNDDVVDIEKPDGICLPTIVMYKFSGFFLHPSIFSIKHLFYYNVLRRHYNFTKIFIFTYFFYAIHVRFLLQKNECNSNKKITMTFRRYSS